MTNSAPPNLNPINLIIQKGDTSVDRYEMHFQGHRGIITKWPNESGMACWQRVQDWIDGRRRCLVREKSLLDPWAVCDIYVGSFDRGVTDKLFHDHMRHQILTGLRRIADDIHTSDPIRKKAQKLIARIRAAT